MCCRRLLLLFSMVHVYCVLSCSVAQDDPVLLLMVSHFCLCYCHSQVFWHGATQWQLLGKMEQLRCGWVVLLASVPYICIQKRCYLLFRVPFLILSCVISHLFWEGARFGVTGSKIGIALYAAIFFSYRVFLLIATTLCLYSLCRRCTRCRDSRPPTGN